MREKLSAVIFDVEKKQHTYDEVKTCFYGKEETIDINVIDLTDASTKKLLQILYEYRGYDAIITIGDNPFIAILNTMPFYFRKKWWHFEVFDAEAITNSIVATFETNIGRKDNNYPLFSIFTCAYKTTKEQALRLYTSLLKQTYNEWDWWIIDDTPYPYESYFVKIKDPRIHIIRNVTAHGNIGFNKHVIGMACDGDYLVEVDHDDELSYDCLEYLKKAFDTYPDIGFAYSYAREECGGETIYYGDYFALGLGKNDECDFEGQKILIPISADVNCLSIRNIVGLPNHVRCWKTEAYHDLCGHNIDISILDDQELLTRTLLRYKACKIPKILYVQHEGERNENSIRGGQSTQTVRFNEIQRLGPILKEKYDKQIHDKFIEMGIEDPYWIDERYSDIWSGVKPNTININYTLGI